MSDFITGEARASERDPAALFSRAQSVHKASRQLEHRQADQLAEAERLYREVLKLRPNNAPATHFLGLLLNDVGRVEEADKLLEKAIELAPGEPTFHSNYGNVLVARGEGALAEAPLRRAVALLPIFPQAHFNLGLSLKTQRRFPEAIDEFRTALRQKAGFVEALVELARCLFDNDKKDAGEALDRLDEAIALDVSYSDAHFFRGHVLSHFGRYDEAVTAFYKAAKLVKNEVTLYELGNALSLAQRNEEACAAFWASMQAKPDYLPSHYAYTQMAWTMGRADVTFASYAYAREKVGEDPKLLNSEASIRIHLNQFDEAAKLLARAHELAPENAEIVSELGRTLALMARYDESYSAYEKALKLVPESPSHLQGFGSALLRGGETAKAIAFLEEAHRMDPRDQMVLGTLATALRQAGDSRYNHLVDYDKYVRFFEVPLPSGFSDAKAFNEVLAGELARFHTRKTEPFDQTLRGGTQSMGHLFKEDSRLVQLVRESIESSVAEYIRDLPDDPSHPTAARKCEQFQFAGSWSCRLKTAGFHTDHVHNMGWISSAYYVMLPSSVEADGQEGWIRFGCSAFKLDANDTPETYVKPIVGRLVLFPSFYWHGTVPFSSSEDRMTVAFDVVPS